jgi:heterotetrameric sarcosine oxidase gamma subunit
MDKFDLDRPTIDSATDGRTLHSENADLILTEIEILSLWSIQGNHQQDLAEFVMAIFSESVAACGMTSAGDLRLLKLWPQRAWLLAHRHSLPAEIAAFEALMTDISHGLCEFRLGGEHAWAFLASYTSVDLASPVGSGCRRCLLGQYPLVLWWDNIGDIHLLIERSYAQSFFDYLAQLMTRWRVSTS